MHRTTPLSTQLYTHLFPNPTSTDPPTFTAHLTKHLIPEVRIETATFYGSLDSTEARYPGLNYTFPPHRKRLGRFEHHARLFAAFDALGWTDSEVLGFCRWEGTVWARERFERDEGVVVRDTTGEEIREWVHPRLRGGREGDIRVKTDIEVEIEEMGEAGGDGEEGDIEGEPMEEDEGVRDLMAEVDAVSDDTDSDEDELQSIGYPLNQQLLQAARLQGQAAPTDPEWEQLLKEAQERGVFLGDMSSAFAARALRTAMRVDATAAGAAAAAAMSQGVARL
ncbi:hypothetical protein H2201_001372 [Coniosporium apollinis]|uniref:Uncharacterized protein n=1 Tax=Coniosporium apollinis TaxID=61459 RepID=A0ABQ9P149_9PEZI|nr:hypothetical protein H2201_001372 [Coniosporium apollinis]